MPSSQSRFAATPRGRSASVQLVSVSIRNAASRCTNAVAPGRTWLICPPHANRVSPPPPALALPGQRCTHRIAVSMPAAGSARARKPGPGGEPAGGHVVREERLGRQVALVLDLLRCGPRGGQDRGQQRGQLGAPPRKLADGGHPPRRSAARGGAAAVHV